MRHDWATGQAHEELDNNSITPAKGGSTWGKNTAAVSVEESQTSCSFLVDLAASRYRCSVAL